MLVIKKDAFHRWEVANVVRCWEENRLPHQVAWDRADEIFRSIVAEDLFNASFLLSILRNLLDEKFKLTKVKSHFAHFETSKCLVEILWSERALILDNSFAEVGNTREVSVYGTQILHQVEWLESDWLRVLYLCAGTFWPH
jgi:hypothetical protein